MDYVVDQTCTSASSKSGRRRTDGERRRGGTREVKRQIALANPVLIPKINLIDLVCGSGSSSASLQPASIYRGP
jgi:hypothetical protein